MLGGPDQIQLLFLALNYLRKYDAAKGAVGQLEESLVRKYIDLAFLSLR